VESTFLARYRPSIAEGLRCVLAGGEPLRSVLRYHVGLEDASGAPAEALGELIRPSLVLLVAEGLGGDREAALAAAVSLELVHEFSRIRDDVRDRARMRHGRPTVRNRCGEAEAINAGDSALAFALAVARTAGDTVLDRIVRAAIETIEDRALASSFEARWPNVDEYTDMIDRKTGALFRCACELGCVVSGAPREMRTAFDEVGRDLGRACRIRDDLREIWDNEPALGEPLGVDVRRWRTSYPVVAAATKAGEGERRMLKAAFAAETPSGGAVGKAVEMMERLGVREDGAREVDGHLGRALSKLERLPWGEDGTRRMKELCEFLRPAVPPGGGR